MPQTSFGVPFDPAGNMLHSPETFLDGRRNDEVPLYPLVLQDGSLLEGWQQIRSADRERTCVHWRDNDPFEATLTLVAHADPAHKLVVVADEGGHLYPMTVQDMAETAARYGWVPTGDGRSTATGRWICKRRRGGRYSIGVA